MVLEVLGLPPSFGESDTPLASRDLPHAPRATNRAPRSAPTRAVPETGDLLDVPSFHVNTQVLTVIHRYLL